MTVDGSRVFRDAWIAGVRAHYPGEPKPGYVTPWEDMPEWERAAAAAVYDVVVSLLASTNNQASRLTRRQKSQFVAVAWTVQMYVQLGDPKHAYVADWDDLPPWQQETDADIFDAIAAHQLT